MSIGDFLNQNNKEQEALRLKAEQEKLAKEKNQEDFVKSATEYLNNVIKPAMDEVIAEIKGGGLQAEISRPAFKTSVTYGRGDLFLYFSFGYKHLQGQIDTYFDKHTQKLVMLFSTTGNIESLKPQKQPFTIQELTQEVYKERCLWFLKRIVAHQNSDR